MVVKPFSSKPGGFTLVEVMLGIVILTLVLIPILSYFTTSVNLVHQLELRSQALYLARNCLETVKAEAVKDWSGLDNMIENFRIDDLSLNHNLLTDYELEIVQENYDINIRKITVTIIWNNSSKQVKLETLICKR